MKYYRVRVYNAKQEFCSSFVLRITDSERIEDFNDPNDRVTEVTREYFYGCPTFERVSTDEANAVERD